ncbi:class I adenylate-forming enzyme family protein [Actinospongicola halichondriae]|uniref:class I adenylate-forming enzyme family protein n=1 Tax=Actinospongicola halichondriae TaxID=3236844 RepID=UPI003D536446
MGVLVAVEARGQQFVDELQRAWSRGDAVVPIDPRLPRAAVTDLCDRLRVGEAVDDGDALVVATSGTTGAPKGVVLSHGNVAASAAATSSFLGIDPDRHHWLACLPLAHVGGLSVVTRALHAGTGLTVHDGFDAAAVDAAAAEGCTHVSLVATALARVDAGRWERIVLGGSAPPPNRPPNSVATYGMTETGSGVVYDGVPLPDVEIRVVDAELQVRGPMVAEQYRDGTPVGDAAGWLHTGDLGSFDDGIVHVDGRRGDMIITGGENVHPDPIERRLREHPAIADVAIVGRPDDTWGQRVVAVVELTDASTEPTLDELRDWVRETLPVWCAPKALEVGPLPRTSLGKIRRAALRGRDVTREG